MKHNVLLLLAGILCITTPAMAQEALVRSISVTGEAEERVTPDQAILSGQLVSRAKQLAAAKEENDKLVERVVAIAKQFNIPKEKVSASNVYISPEYDYQRETNKQILKGYVITRQLSITMDALDIHEQVLSALVENNIDQVNGVQFQISDTTSREDALRVKAVAHAKQRADMLARAAGAKLGKVLTITTAGAVSRPMPVMMRSMDMAEGGMAKSSVAPSLPGQVNLSQTISITYELE